VGNVARNTGGARRGAWKPFSGCGGHATALCHSRTRPRPCLGLLHDIAAESGVQLVAIADPHPELVALAKTRVPSSVLFYDDFVKMLDEAKPDAVVVTTANDKHLAILRECAQRHIHYSVEKPMATTSATPVRWLAWLVRQTSS